MVTINTDNKLVSNDLNLPVLAKYDGDPTHIIEYCKCDTGFTPRPGTPCKKKTGAAGEFIIIAPSSTTDLIDPDCNYVVELDLSQISLCSDSYAAADVVPVINLKRCRGALLRNIVLKDPNAVVNSEAKLGACLDTTGKFKLLTEPTLTTGTDANYGFQTGTLHVDGATGTLMLGGNVKLRNKYYIADPGADTTIVAEVE